MDEKAKKKGRKFFEVMNSNVADDKEVQSLDDNQESKMKKRKKYDSSLNGLQELGFSKPSKKVRKDNRLKSNEGEDDDQGKQVKKKSDAESQHEDYNEFKSNEDKDDNQYKKEVKTKKKKLSEESKSKEYNEFESNEGGDNDQGKNMKKKKLCDNSKSKENHEFDSKQMKKNKSDVGRQHEDCDEFKSNENKDDSQYRKEEKKRKKKKLSEESKSKEYNEFETNEGEDDGQGQKRKKKKLSEESKSKEYNEFERNEGEDDGQVQKRKKKKLSEESKSKEYNEFERNEGDDHHEGKKRKKKKLSEESKSKEYNEFESNEGEDDSQGKKMKKKKKKLRDKTKNKENSEFHSNEGDVTEVDDLSKKMKTKKKAEADIGESPIPAQSGSSKPKRVTFSDQVDVCCDGLVRGKRFSPEEDEKIKFAVFGYIESHGLGDEGLDMVLHCKSHPEVRDCWKDIGAALPERPYVSVYTRAHILFERGEKRRWAPEEFEFLRKVKEQHGADWKSVAEALGKHRIHVKDAWRRIKLTNTNRGRWTQEEYQNLFDLVNLDLCVRASQGYRNSKHGMLRDNIGWEAIGDKLSTRSSAVCCQKWYDKLTSPMVADGVWSDTDDYRLVNALFTLDACCMEEVDWDNLLEHRPGDVCRKRWNQMVQYIGEHGGKSFAEQVEILAKRFCPDLVEVREAFDGKPLVC